MNINTKKKDSGVTLVELMVVMGIMGILASIAIPNFLIWQSSYSFKKAVKDMYSGFQLARLAAIEEHCLGTIVFNQPVNGVTYDYVVFAENLKDGAGKSIEQDMEYDAGEKILAKVKLSAYKYVIFDPAQGYGGDGSGISFPKNDDDLKAIAFRPGGFPRSNSGALGMGSAYLKNIKNNMSKGIVLSAGGRIRVE